MTLTRSLIDAGRLVPLFAQRLAAGYAHYLVVPPRSRDHAGLAAVREWTTAQAQAFVAQDTASGNARRQRGKRRRS